MADSDLERDLLASTNSDVYESIPPQRRVLVCIGHDDSVTEAVINALLKDSAQSVQIASFGFVLRSDRYIDLPAIQLSQFEHAPMLEALEQCDVLYLFPPAHEQRERLARQLIDVAVEASVPFVVLHSSSAVAVNHSAHSYTGGLHSIEQHLEFSGLEHVILRCAPTPEQIFGNLTLSRATQRLQLPCEPETRCNCITRSDIALAASAAVRKSSTVATHTQTVYSITNPHGVVSYRTMIHELYPNAHCVNMGEATWEKLRQWDGVSASYVRDWALWIRRGETMRASGDFQALTGRRPTDMLQWCAERKREMRGAHPGEE
eukprot:TRINITY_DN14513_c0_g1_i1.p1 TRINITY_DN14513_c0_g1~~TRINITY_DN14513_c0_g1_i1.p1  ORF type:complete len:319 (+),score=36.94 TRINITY_DN14513_c0_g1_i1:181-1137(+)